jgi:ribonuclease-3
VNFKSKLLEWTQKNRVKMEFQILKQTTDEKGSPVFGYVVMIEGVEGGKGQGFSKKEAQQEASKNTLQRLRREPQFIDAIFQAKSERTKMEEEPTAIAPDLEQEKEFIISTENGERSLTENGELRTERYDYLQGEQADGNVNSKTNQTSQFSDLNSQLDNEFDLSDITHNPRELSREEIIAAAEAAAYES